MLITTVARKAETDSALSDLAIEGLEPDSFGKKLIDDYIEGVITPEQAIKKLKLRDSLREPYVNKVA